MGNRLHSLDGYGILLATKDGYLVCPVCRVNKKLLRIDPRTAAHNLRIYCRSCKSEIMIDIVEGQCYQSRSR